jgi:hypothetical protein
MIYWVVLEYHAGHLNSVRGPYNSDIEAYAHIDKCKDYRSKRPIPFRVTWKAVKTYPPEYVG